MKAALKNLALFLAFLALMTGVFYLGWIQGVHEGLKPEVTRCAFDLCPDCPQETP